MCSRPGRASANSSRPALSEVGPPVSSRNDHDVGALDHLALQGGGSSSMETLGRRLAKRSELLRRPRRPLGLLLLRQSVHLGPRRAKGWRRSARTAGAWSGQRLARGVDGRPSDEGGSELEGGAVARPHLEHLAGFRRHLLPDAVAPSRRDLVRRHDQPLPGRREWSRCEAARKRCTEPYSHSALASWLRPSARMPRTLR